MASPITIVRILCRSHSQVARCLFYGLSPTTSQQQQQQREPKIVIGNENSDYNNSKDGVTVEKSRRMLRQGRTHNDKTRITRCER